jgi:hypothetical protein
MFAIFIERVLELRVDRRAVSIHLGGEPERRMSGTVLLEREVVRS